MNNDTETKIRYTLGDIKIGMKVKSAELANIVDIWIALDNAILVQDGPFNTCYQGTIIAISNKRNTLHYKSKTGNCVLICNPWWERDPLCSVEY